MKISEVKNKPYTKGKFKGMSARKVTCCDNGYTLDICETLGSDEIALVFSSSFICTVKSFDSGVDIAKSLFDKFKKPDYLGMVKFCGGLSL